MNETTEWVNTWCEHCRDHFDQSHYGADGYHKTGAAYGPVGKGYAESDVMKVVVETARDVVVRWQDGAGTLVIIAFLGAVKEALDKFDSLSET